MTDRELERRLRDALDHAAPDDLEGLLSRCGDQKGTVIPMTKQNSKTSRRRFLPLLTAACLVVVIAGGAFGVSSYQQSHTVASIVSLDVNPSIELTLNSKERVLSATPLNDDAVAILDGMDLVGDDLNKAMNAIIGSLLMNGYVDELANSILITVEDSDAARAAALQQKLNQEAEAILANAQVNGAILTQVLENSDQLKTQADTYGISAGKAALIQTIVDASGGTQTFEGLVGLSINELNLLSSGATQSGTDTATTLTSTGTASQSAYIGSDAAQAAALQHAGVSASDASMLRTTFDYEDGRMVYEVEFRAGQTRYDYDIDAATGDVVSYQHKVQATQSSSGTDIGSAAAQSAALTHAGITSAQTTGLRAVGDYDDGLFVYEVEFWVGTTEYDYEIDGYTGNVISYQVKTHTVAGGSGAGTGTGSGTGSGTDIGAAEAKAAALAAAGITEDQATGLRTERDYDDGRLIYEVEFWNGTTEYDYTINGYTGEVIAYDRETHQTAANTDIGSDAAQAAALSAAGASQSQATGLRVQREYDDGRLEYEVEFWVGTTEWDITVDGATGSILAQQREDHPNAISPDQAVGRDAALTAALNHAGVSQSNAYDIEVEQELDSRTPHYEVQFKSGGMEYEYRIDASSGAVLSYESDWDD